MGFNVTTLGQKDTVYEGKVGLDVTRNKATGVKNHIIDIDKKMNKSIGPIALFCQITGQRTCCSVLYNHLL